MQWTDANQDAFIQLCYDFVKAGKLQCSTFKSDDWGKINDELLRITNNDYGIARLKGKWNRLRMTHQLFSQLIGHTRVTWDPNTNKVNAPDEVWEHFYTLEAYRQMRRSIRTSRISAIDGTHVAAWSPASRHTSFRGRKTNVTHNVMLACDFDMKFTFVYAGWEGTSNDSRVFIDAVTNTSNGFPMPCGDEWYLVDAGYPNIPGFLAPYRGRRYHLRDYAGRVRLQGKGRVVQLPTLLVS